NDYELKREARLLNERRLKLQKNNFSQGRISTRELIMTQADFHSSRMKEAAAFMEYIKAVSAWNRTAGKYDAYYNDYMKEKEK
ncbi:MAG TPA: hypothetical protein P5511_04460, partial [Candidatus Goldiibacteriota bacterium]|nr:hypothetical protein [Candidatus Goldiibacteriota bacterium]